jgi:hypothetical protein
MADTAVTLPATYKGSIPHSGFDPFKCNTKWTIPYSQVNTGTGSTDTVTVTLGSTPAKFVINQAWAVVTTAWAGTTAFSMTVGTTTTTNAMIASADLIALSQYAVLPPAANCPVATNLKGTSSLGLVAVFTNATGGSPSAITAGSVDIYANVIDVTDVS